MTELDQQQQHARSQTMARTTAFTDASVAIALTLLILPLADVGRAGGNRPVGTLLNDERSELLGFFLSFAVILRFWSVHRRLWEGLADYSETTVGLNFLWLLTVVFLPFPTALLTSGKELSSGGAAFYIATLLATSLTGLAMTWHINRRPTLRLPFHTDAILKERLIQGLLSALVILGALVVSLFRPGAGLLVLCLLAATRLPLRSSGARHLLRL